MVIKLNKLKYIKTNKILLLLFALPLITKAQEVQNTPLSIGLIAGYEFSSAYYENNDVIQFDEHIKTNYSFGFLLGRLDDSRLIGFKYGIYYKYRSFQIDIKADQLDPNYNNFLTKIKPEYHIIGIPVFAHWKLYSGNSYFIRAITGLSFEMSIIRNEKSKFNDGTITESRRLIADNDWRTGIPLNLGIGADIDLGEKFRLGLYPTMNLYLNKFNLASESSYASTFGINLLFFYK